VTRKERIRNEYIRESIRIALIIDKIRKNRFKWSCYEKRRFESSKNGYEI